MSDDRSLRERRRLVRAELWLHLGMIADEYANAVDGSGEATLPFAEWPADDALCVLARKYDFAPAELAKSLRDVAARCEAKALAGGYAEIPDDPTA